MSSNTLRAYNISHPVFRLIYRFISTTIHGLGDASKLNQMAAEHLYSCMEHGLQRLIG